MPNTSPLKIRLATPLITNIVKVSGTAQIDVHVIEIVVGDVKTSPFLDRLSDFGAQT
jgi:hypothetical protein